MSTKNGAIYVRVSSKAQVGGESLDFQVDDCRQCADRDGVTIDDGLVFREEGVSGRLASRPQIDRLLDAAENGRFEILYVWKISRFGRNTRNNLELLERLTDFGVSVKFVHDNFSSDDRFMLTILSAVAEMESNNIGEQAAAGMAASAAKGHFMGGTAPFGTKSVEIDDRSSSRVLVEDHDKAEAIREAVQLVVHAGASTGDIARMWNGRGLLTTHGKRWKHQNVQRLLGSSRLMGEYAWNEHPIDHPAILTVDEFRELQTSMATGRRGPRERNRDSWLSGRIRCTCGGYYVSSGRHGTRGWSAPYYRCSRNTPSLGDDRCTARRWLNAETVETLVWQTLGSVLPKNPSMAAAVVDPSLLSPSLEHIDSGYCAPPVTFRLLTLIGDPMLRTKIRSEIAAAWSEHEARQTAVDRLLVDAAKTGDGFLDRAVAVARTDLGETRQLIQHLEAQDLLLAEAQTYETEFDRVVDELVELGTTQDPAVRRNVVEALDVRVFLRKDGRSVLITGSPHRYIRRFDMKSCPASRRRSRRPPHR